MRLNRASSTSAPLDVEITVPDETLGQATATLAAWVPQGQEYPLSIPHLVPPLSFQLVGYSHFCGAVPRAALPCSLLILDLGRSCFGSAATFTGSLVFSASRFFAMASRAASVASSAALLAAARCSSAFL